MTNSGAPNIYVPSVNTIAPYFVVEEKGYRSTTVRLGATLSFPANVRSACIVALLSFDARV